MDKNEIQKNIYSLKTEEEIMEFINRRLSELENETQEKTVGEGYTDKFSDYIGEKIHFKAGDKIMGFECPDVKFDDYELYITLIQNIKEYNWYNEVTILNVISLLLSSYLPKCIGKDMDRFELFSSNIGKSISIKEIKARGLGLCAEYTGLAQNILKFLGIDAEYCCGGLLSEESEYHAFNFIYPNGYNNGPVILYDASNYLKFVKDDKSYLLGYYAILSNEEYVDLLNGKKVIPNLTKTENNYLRMYGDALEGFCLEKCDNGYALGIENVKKLMSGSIKL